MSNLQCPSTDSLCTLILPTSCKVPYAATSSLTVTYFTFVSLHGYRLSPVVSGALYVVYAGFVITLIPKSRDARATAASNSGFPDSWAHNGAGRTGLCLAGIAFLAGMSGLLQIWILDLTAGSMSEH